jgi:hypothetical protein
LNSLFFMTQPIFFSLSHFQIWYAGWKGFRSRDQYRNPITINRYRCLPWEPIGKICRVVEPANA